jgi:uncharacterized protein YecE (DUF72 family)
MSRENVTHVRVGTSGWNYPEWKGTFYPDDMKPAAMLPYYTARFDTVEVNATFYRMPTDKTVKGWAATAPHGFTFVLKAPQRITHFARLRDVDDSVRMFCDVARGLGARLGPLLFQLPPNFKKDVGRLGDVLYMVPPDLRVAWEFRHDSWFADDVYERLRGRNAALAIVEDEDRVTPTVATADWGYFRLRAVDYTDARLGDWVKRIRGVGAAWRDAFVFFKHEERGTGPALAERLLGLLQDYTAARRSVSSVDESGSAP